ncbi:MAG: hypothetical protein HQK58_12920 [Deltaproteobacteria bacterium]|nr:hypothetical protein [Deltaproteobacteria bacterium]
MNQVLKKTNIKKAEMIGVAPAKPKMMITTYDDQQIEFGRQDHKVRKDIKQIIVERFPDPQEQDGAIETIDILVEDFLAGDEYFASVFLKVVEGMDLFDKSKELHVLLSDLCFDQPHFPWMPEYSEDLFLEL